MILEVTFENGDGQEIKVDEENGRRIVKSVYAYADETSAFLGEMDWKDGR